MADMMQNANPLPEEFKVKVLRQDGPGQNTYWEHHRVDYEQDMNVISVLQRIAAQSETIEGKSVAPVAWDCNCLEEVCGACTMVINGRTRQSCTALVDRLLEEDPEVIELQPMRKFPVLRDLVVDRSRLFRSLQKTKCWVFIKQNRAYLQMKKRIYISSQSYWVACYSQKQRSLPCFRQQN